MFEFPCFFRYLFVVERICFRNRKLIRPLDFLRVIPGVANRMSQFRSRIFLQISYRLASCNFVMNWPFLLSVLPFVKQLVFGLKAKHSLLKGLSSCISDWMV